MSTVLRRIASGFLALVLVWPSMSLANDHDPMTYQVKQGDTLYRLSDAYLREGRKATAELSRINNIRNPNAIPVGKTLNIPRSLLKYETVAFRISNVAGPVEIAGEAASKGRVLREGERIVTGKSGFVTFTAANGGVVSIPSNSNLRLLTARRYALGDTLDVDFQVVKGRSVIRAPKLQGQERYRLRTPNAVTAVRGTVFRVGHDEERGVSTSEVVEGRVAVADDAKENLADAGFGLAATPDGVGEVEELLSAPVLAAGNAMQTKEQLGFSVTGISGAVAYRTQVATEAGFLDIVDEAYTTDGQSTFASLPNGTYFIRTRAVAESGLEGLSEVETFRRKRVGVTATAGPSPLEDGFKFAWTGEGEGNTSFAFQLWRDGQEGTLLADEIGLTDTAMVIVGMEPGVYHWRVAAQQLDEGEVVKVWAPSQKLTISE